MTRGCKHPPYDWFLLFFNGLLEKPSQGGCQRIVPAEKDRLKGRAENQCGEHPKPELKMGKGGHFRQWKRLGDLLRAKGTCFVKTSSVSDLLRLLGRLSPDGATCRRNETDTSPKRKQVNFGESKLLVFVSAWHQNQSCDAHLNYSTRVAMVTAPENRFAVDD